MTELRIDALVEALSKAGVEFIVIGGVAVGWHGYVRATKDLDIVPAPDSENLERLAVVLRSLGAEVEGAGDFDADELPDPTDPRTLAQGGNWILNTSLGRLDLMQAVGERDLWPVLIGRAVEDEIADARVKICAFEDLVELKQEAGRPEDFIDLERLRAARGSSGA